MVEDVTEEDETLKKNRLDPTRAAVRMTTDT